MNSKPMKSPVRASFSLLLAAAALALTTAAFAIQPGQWSHTTEADFEPGDTDSVVVTNLGDIKLASSTAKIGDMPEGVNIIYDLRVVTNGDLYIAAGPEGRLLRRKGQEIQQVVELKKEQIFALDQTADGGLLVAISGEKSRLAILDGDQLKTVVELEGVRYIWDTIVDGNDVFLATGPEGKLLQVNLNDALSARPRVNPDPAPAPVKEKDKAKPEPAPAKDAKPAEKANDKPAPKAADKTGEKAGDKPAEKPLPTGVRVVLDAQQANLLCLGRDRQGRLYVGTDTDGLVYRVTVAPLAEPEAFVLFDAPEPEIGALLVTPDGTVYAGTADADQARPGRLEAAAEREQGRPEPGTPTLPVQPKPEPKGKEKGKETGDRGQGTGDGGSETFSRLAETPQASGSDVQLPSSLAVAADDASAIQLAQATPAAPKADGPAGAKPDPAKSESAEPTPAQYDQLREEIRQRLQKARQTGELQAGPSSPRPATGTTRRPTTSPGSTRPAAAKQGNAVYRIDLGGFVTEIFRESTMILRLLEDGDTLLVATGNEGHVFRVNPAADETSVVVDLEPKQVPAMFKAADGKVLLATGSPASLVRLDEGFAAAGSYISPVMDASQISLWGKLNLMARVPDGTSISIQTRSGNVQDPDRAAWSKWSVPRNLAPEAGAPGAAASGSVSTEAPREIAVTSPPARFMQYKLTLNGNGKATPVVEKVTLAYVVPNIRPVVTAVRASYPDVGAGGSGPGKSGGKPARATGAGAAGGEPPVIPEQSALTIEWEASDANGDQLRYTLEYRAINSDKWLPLTEDVTTNSFEWQTKRVPDGRYVIRLTAGDGADNPGAMALASNRASDPVLVDNTPPTIENRKVEVNARTATLTAGIADSLSAIRAVQYGVDTTNKWQPVLPDDLIYDSTRETITIKLTGLAPGSHVVTIRATDALGNTQYVSEVVEIK